MSETADGKYKEARIKSRIHGGGEGVGGYTRVSKTRRKLPIFLE